MKLAAVGVIAAAALLGIGTPGARSEPAGAPSAARAAKRLEVANLRQATAPFRDTVLKQRHPRRFYDSPPTPYPTADGMTVYVSFSDYYTPDPAIAQSYVTFLGWLIHGSEMNGLYVYVYTPAQVTAVCGTGAVACYSSDGYMVIAGEDTAGVPVEQAIAHEYGHRIAQYRMNTPWPAFDWGPKRWATYENVCWNVDQGRMFPGVETQPQYQLNPGEGWAEAYRYMNERRAGTWPPIGWIVVDPYFVPDTTALDLISLDVTQPWTGPTVYVKKGRFRGGGKRQWTFRPYDGPMSATVTGPRGTTVTFVVGGKVVRRPARRVAGVVCGEPAVTVRVQSKRAGLFALHVSEDSN
jgi:hypothetical protein